MVEPHRCSITGCLVVLLLTWGAAAEHHATYRLPLADGHVHLSQLLEVALDEAGLSIPLDHNHTDPSFPVSDNKSQVVLALTNAVTTPLGVTLKATATHFIITVDRTLLRQRINQLEAWLRIQLDHPAVYALRRIDMDSAGPPVVLVHGIDSGIDRLRGAAEALSNRGYDTYLFDYPDDTDITTSARQLGGLLGGLRQKTQQRITVVTTSMGGVVTRAWLELQISGAPTLAERTEIDRFIACVPPFKGAPMAKYHLISEVTQVLSEALVGAFSSLFLWDGFGQAAHDLKPDSDLMTRFEKTRRHPNVKYSIIAGRRGIVPDIVFEAAKEWVQQRLDTAGTTEKVAWGLLGDALAVARAAGEGRGDGVVPLSSTTLPNVDDYTVTEMNHLECLSKRETKTRQIPGLDLVVSRLPAPNRSK